MSTVQERVGQELRLQELQRMLRTVGLRQVLKDLQLCCELREAAYRIAGSENAERAWRGAAMTLGRVAPRNSIIDTEPY